MPKIEPYATDEEFKSRIIHYPDVPLSQLVPGTTSHIVPGERALVSFLTMSANSFFPPHLHEAEQIMIVIEGYMDEIIEGKLYRVKKGDVIVLPSNIEHGGRIREVDCKAIDIFCPPRIDYIEKHRKALDAQRARKQ